MFLQRSINFFGKSVINHSQPPLIYLWPKNGKACYMCGRELLQVSRAYNLNPMLDRLEAMTAVMVYDRS